MRVIDVVPYRDEWARLYEEERAMVASLLGDNLQDIYHIGSTAVPGLAAKPVIDMMAAVNSLDEVDLVNEQLAGLGYEAKGEFGIGGRRFFMKGGDERTHHLHVFLKGSSELTRHLALRDYLRANPAEAKRYGDLKLQLAALHPNSIDDYIAGKSSLVKELEAKALSTY